MSEQILYFKPERSTVVYKENINIEDIGTVFCQDPAITNAVEKISLFTFHKNMDGRQVITVLKVISLIKQEFPDVTVLALGDPEFIVFHKKPEPAPKKERTITIIKVILVSLVSLFGAAFTIMTYNNDVGVNEVFNQIYTLFTGEVPKKTTILHLGYALGLPVGLIYFFNHVAYHRLSDDPTPLETQMRIYERDVNDGVAISSGRNKKTLDVS
ncbi:MAG: stage V sporulation protein AA [Lachnospira sp.]|nr:stage V sporulation protein AA [Lachnospira sp.]